MGGTSYRLNDKVDVEKIAKVFEGANFKTMGKENEVKGYDYYIYANGLKIGLTQNPLNDSATKEKVNQFTVYSGDSYMVVRTDVDVSAQIQKIISDAEKVSVNFDKMYRLNSDLFSKSSNVSSAIEISKNTFARSKSVVLVGENSIPDSLSSAGLAGNLDAPILLSEKDKLNPALLSELKRLHTKDVYVASGTDVISNSVVDSLKKEGFTVVSVSGKDRYETSYNIAKLIGGDKFIIASGQNFNDVPSISPYAFENKRAVVLSRKDALTEQNLSLLNKKSEVLVVGGRDTISNKVFDKLNSLGVKNSNIAGKDRYETSEKIVKTLYPDSKKFVYESSKNVLMDIVSSTYSVKYKMPILIKSDKLLDNMVLNFFPNDKTGSFLVR